MRAVVTGGAGFLGSHLCDRLLAAGHTVLCVDNFVTGSVEHVKALILEGRERFQFLKLDLRTAQALSSVSIDRLNFDVIYHLASPASPVAYQADPLGTIRVGVNGTDYVARLARATGARLVFASTSEVYGSPDAEHHPQVEEYWGNVNPNGPRACYDESKRCAEALLLAHAAVDPDFDVRIARVFNTYGPRMSPDDGRVISTFIRQALTGKPLTVFGKGTQTRSLCYVADLVAGLMRLGSVPRKDLRARPAVYNLGNPDERTVMEIAAAVVEATGHSKGITYLPLPKDDPPRRAPSIFRAVSDLDWHPRVPFEDGLRLTIDWHRRRAARAS